jgi:hypothetical protein
MPDRIRSQGVPHSEVGVATPRILYDNSSYFKQKGALFQSAEYWVSIAQLRSPIHAEGKEARARRNTEGHVG